MVKLLEKMYISQEEGFAKLRTEIKPEREEIENQNNNGQSQWENEGDENNQQNFQQNPWENGSSYNSNFRHKQHKECKYCGKMGHVQKDCYTRMNDERRGENQATTMSTDLDTKVRFRTPDTYKVNSVLCDELNQ